MKIVPRRSWRSQVRYICMLAQAHVSPAAPCCRSSPICSIAPSPRRILWLHFSGLHSAAIQRTLSWKGTRQAGLLALELWYRPFQIVFRALVILAEVAMLSVWHFTEKDINKRAERLRESLIRLGPFYIKLGQALSTRPDILPNVYCSELSKLQDQIPPFPSPRALKFIERELGAPASKLFAEISEEPLAAASLGQVYKARLHSGEYVAVKVLRPNVPSRLLLDARLLHLVGGQLQRFAKARGDIAAVVNEMVGRMLEETDYINEARNTERFARLYGINYEDKNEGETRKGMQKSSKGLVKVPKIYWDYTSKGVLTMEWIDGVKLTHRDKLEKMKLDVQDLVDQGVFCSLRQLLEDGFFHADPHPGNLVVTKDGVLAYFDFGMMSDFPRHYRIGLIRTLVHFVNRDSEGLAKDFLSLGFIPEDTDLKPIIQALRESYGDEKTKAQLDFQGIMTQLADVMYEFNFRLPPEFGLVIRALGSLEGTATALDPDFRVIESAYPFVIGRLLSDADPDMRQILYELLIRKNGSIRWHRLEKLVLAISQGKNGKDSRSSSFNMRAVASAADDVLTYILSERGIRVRILLVKDVAKALDQLIKEGIYEFYGLDTQPVAAEGSVRLRHAEAGDVKDERTIQRQERGKLVSRFRSWVGGNEEEQHSEDKPSQGQQQQQRQQKKKSKTSGARLNPEQSRAEGLSSRMSSGFQGFYSAISAAPEVWLPLLIKVASDREAQKLAASILSASAESYNEHTSEASFMFISKQLHREHDSS